MRYVVTGSAGFIGSHLVTTLERHGHIVYGVDLEQDLTEYVLDLNGVDGIFHLAGQPGVRDSWDNFEVYLNRNLMATKLVLDQARDASVRVVYASSSSVYGDAAAYPTAETVTPQPVSPYGVTKLACEHLADAFKLDAVGLRYFTVYGPRQRPDMAFTRIFDAIAHGTTFQLYGDGRAIRSFTYVQDAVDATILAMHYGRAGVYNIGGGTETTMNEALALAVHISGRDLEVERVEVAAGDVRRTSADISKAKHDLGWEPSTTLPEGMAAQWAHVLVPV